MARIVIDARESGTSTGRYIDKLLEHLHSSKPAEEIVVVTRPDRVSAIKEFAPTFDIRPSRYKEFTFGEQLGFSGQLKRLRPDLVHFGMTQQPIRYRGQVVTTMHDLTTIRFRNPARNRLIFWFKQQVYKWLTKRVAKKSARILVPSEFVKKDVVDYTSVPASKITVTYEAADKIADPAEPVTGLRPGNFIMYVGRPQEHKNLRRLMSAYKQLKTDRPDLRLALVGRFDELYRRHKRWADREGIEDVVFTDFVSDGQLRWLYENCQAYVFPSLSEGFGLPGLEAMASGAPVVASDATCLPEIYGSAALYFDPLDATDMAAKIRSVLTDERLRANLIQKGHARVKHYSWRRMAEQTLAVYRQALG